MVDDIIQWTVPWHRSIDALRVEDLVYGGNRRGLDHCPSCLSNVDHSTFEIHLRSSWEVFSESQWQRTRSVEQSNDQCPESSRSTIDSTTRLSTMIVARRMMIWSVCLDSRCQCSLGPNGTFHSCSSCLYSLSWIGSCHCCIGVSEQSIFDV